MRRRDDGGEVEEVEEDGGRTSRIVCGGEVAGGEALLLVCITGIAWGVGGVDVAGI